ncbi:MAG: TIGR00730 family Rossman fold protein [Gammaproteobacteria bacterium]
MKKIKTLCVFCGASKGISPIYAEAARQLADVILAADMTLVYGGGNVGLMGELAHHMTTSGGKIIGVMPDFLIKNEIAHTELSEFHIVDSMSARKTLITELSDAFVLLPGGIGSLDEFFEIITLSQVGLHNKPRGILNTAHYYDDLLKFLDHSVKEQFWNSENRDRIIIEENPQELVNGLLNYNAPLFDRWNTVTV